MRLLLPRWPGGEKVSGRRRGDWLRVGVCRALSVSISVDKVDRGEVMANYCESADCFPILYEVDCGEVVVDLSKSAKCLLSRWLSGLWGGNDGSL